jgi:hypothetical protein
MFRWACQRPPWPAEDDLSRRAWPASCAKPNSPEPGSWLRSLGNQVLETKS